MADSLPAFPPPAGDIVGMDATTLAAAVRARRLSCVEVMGAFLDRIDQVNPTANAIVARRDRDALIAEARHHDERLGRGDATGPLYGLPIAVKDLDNVKGIRTTMGSPIFRDWVPATDSLMVKRLRAAGAIIIGKTNTPEFGLGSQTYNPVYGATRNAYDPSRTAGGSSGGAAVALALDMLPVADGSDYGGSLRNPAGWNNVFGLRPSFGRVPSDTRDLWLPSMGTAGPMARTVPDLALLLSVQSGYDVRAPLSLDEDPAVFRQDLARDVKGTRIAWVGDFNGYLPFEPGVLDLCRQALTSFEAMGCIVEDALPAYPVEPVWQAWVTLRAWQAGGGLRALYDDPAKRALMKPEAVFEVESGQRLSAYDISDASAIRSAWYHAVQAFLETYDFFVLPTAQLFPFDVDLPWPREIAGRTMTTYHEWMKVVLPVTMSGCPTVAVPAGFNEAGLPMGLQIVGRNRGELACLQIAEAYDKATQWVTRHRPGRARS
jgi:amidase